MKIPLTIISKDLVYVRHLSYYLQKEYGHLLQVTYEQDLDGVCLNDASMIIIVDVITCNVDVQCSSENVFYLGEEENLEKKVLSKYKPLRQTMKYILSEITIENMKEQSYVLHANQILGIYSPIGGSGKTTIATALCSLMANHEEVIYLNLESYPSNPWFWDEGAPYNLSDLLFLIDEDESNMAYTIEKVVCKHPVLDVYYFNPHNRLEDISELDIHLWVKLLKALSQKYGKVVIDFDSYLNKTTKSLLSNCGYRLYINCEGILEKQKNHIYNLDSKEQQFTHRIMNKCRMDREWENYTTCMYYEDLNEVDAIWAMTKHPIIKDLIPLYENIEGGDSHG